MKLNDHTNEFKCTPPNTAMTAYKVRNNVLSTARIFNVQPRPAKVGRLCHKTTYVLDASSLSPRTRPTCDCFWKSVLFTCVRLGRERGRNLERGRGERLCAIRRLPVYNQNSAPRSRRGSSCTTRSARSKPPISCCDLDADGRLGVSSPLQQLLPLRTSHPCITHPRFCPLTERPGRLGSQRSCAHPAIKP